MTFRTGRSFSFDVRAFHETDVPTVGAFGRGGGPADPIGPSRPPRRPRRRALAAGSAVLAQVWGLGLGVTGAYAASGEPVSDLVGRADAPALLDGVTGAAGPVLDPPPLGGTGTAVGQVLQKQIKAGGLPLPGQATAVPDAFAIAAVLVPAVPAQARGDDDAPRASRSDPGDSARTAVPVIPAQRSADADEAVLAALHRDVRTADPAPRTVTTANLSDAGQPANELALTTTAPVGSESGDTGTAVLVPIAAGLLLTGAAMYKHRGLPRGH